MDLLNLAAKITLDTSEYESGLKSFGSKVKSGFSTIGKIGAAAIGTATAAIVGFSAASVKTGAEFDKSMSQVAATMGTTVDEIKTLRDFALQMGATTAFSATQAADALNYMALAGYDAEKSMEMLPNVLNLAAAGGIDLARASDMVTDAESALGLKGQEVTEMIDQMAKTASKSNTSVEQLGEAILTLGGTATLMAGGTDRLATVFGILADNGIKGSEAGTHLRNMLLKLSSPTKEGADAIKELGLEVFDSEGKMRDMQDIIQDLGSALDGLTDEQKIQYISTLFNARDVSAVNALLNTTEERWNELGDAIVDSQGAAEAMAKTQLDNLAGDVTLLKSAYEGLQITVSDKLTPSLREFVQFGTDNLGKVSDALASGDFDAFIDAIGETIADGLAMVAKKIPQAMEAGRKLFSSIMKGITQNLPQIAKAGVEIIVELGIGIVDALPQLIAMIPVIISSIWNALQENWPRIKEAGLQLLSMLMVGMSDGLAAGLGAIVNLVSGLWDKVKSVTVNKWASIKSNVAQKWDGIKADAASKVEAIKSAMSTAWETIKGTVSAKVEGMKAKVSSTFEGIRSTVKGVIDKIKGFLSFEWNLPHLPLPHIRLSGGQWPWGLFGEGVKPEVYIDWYKKAYANPYMFTKPTVMGFGDGDGGEIVYGHENLMNDIKDAVNSASNAAPITINVYPAPGMDINQLATAIEQKLVSAQKQRSRVYA